MPNKPYLDISGQRFGRLIAQKRVFRKNGSTRWHCVCDCGNVAIVGLSNLTHSITRSCGCLRKETARNHLKKIMGPCRCSTIKISKMFTYYRRNAARRGHEWNITPMDFEQFLSAPCFYCGSVDHIGLDRVNVKVGYDWSNVVACCTSCNQAKNDKTVAEFSEWVTKISSFLKEQKWDKDLYATLVHK